MKYSDNKREYIFFSVLFLIFYLLTSGAISYFAIKMNFLSFGGLIPQHPVVPDILFALVLCTAILNSKRRAVIFGIIFGFVVELTCNVPAFSPLVYCICGHFAYGLSSSFAGRGAVNAMITAMPLLLPRVLVSTFYLLGTWHDISFAGIMLGAVLPEFIYNVLAVGVVFLLLRLLMRIFKIEQMI